MTSETRVLPRCPEAPYTAREPLAAQEPPNRQYVRYALAIDPRVLKLFGFKTFCKKSPLIKAIRINLKTCVQNLYLCSHVGQFSVTEMEAISGNMSEALLLLHAYTGT